MILNKSDYNPFPAIKNLAQELGGIRFYNNEFYDYVKKQLFLGGVVPETTEEFDEILALLVNMEII